jgi:hypothetical protein
MAKLYYIRLQNFTVLINIFSFYFKISNFWPSDDGKPMPNDLCMQCLGMAWHGRARQGMAGHGRTWQGMAGHGRAWQGLAGLGRAWQSMFIMCLQ